MLLLLAPSWLLQAAWNQGSVTARRCIRSEIYRSAGEDAPMFFPRGPTPANSSMRRFALGQDVCLCGLTPELSRTAARNGGVVHVTMQPSREAVSA